VSNNLFTEIGLSSVSSSEEEYLKVNKLVEDADGNISKDESPTVVVNGSAETMDFSLGMGYTIVWREHFAVEPFVNLNFKSGEQKSYNPNTLEVDAFDVKSTNFDLGVSFSLFF
jgi:hypothetical protein